MKKFILAALAASVALSPMAATTASAQSYQQQRHTEVVRNGHGQTVVTRRTVTRDQGYRSNWRKGERFNYHQARNYRQIDYRQHRGLRAPPRGYRYVQSGNDAVLVGITSGVIAAVIAGALR